MPVRARDCHVDVDEVTPERGRELFDARTQELLGVTGEEFLAARRRGQYPMSWSHEAVHELEMLVPFAE